MSVEKIVNKYPIHHIGLAVKDLKTTIKFLEDFMGMKPWNTMGEFASTKEEMLVGDTFVMNGAFCRMPGQVAIELLQPINSPNSPWGQHIAKHGEGLHHIAIMVPDWEELVARLKKLGCTVEIAANKEFPGGRARYCYLRTKTAGILYELMDTGPGAANPW
jgi:methylmalonyl-CoA/ethylmalonyl-CoA epimerase